MMNTTDRIERQLCSTKGNLIIRERRFFWIQFQQNNQRSARRDSARIRYLHRGVLCPSTVIRAKQVNQNALSLIIEILGSGGAT